MKILYSSQFARQYKALPMRLKLIAEKKEVVFRANPFDARLKTHKLQGRLKDFWAFSLGRKHRIIFNLENAERFISFQSAIILSINKNQNDF